MGRINEAEEWIRSSLGIPLGRINEAEKLAVGTIIVPPNGSVTVEEVTIRNLTDEDLEFWLRVNGKLKELAVSKVQ